jgi:phosphatidylinositol dimannoside acyltransferase
MPNDIQRIINSPFGVSLVTALGRSLPPRLGYRIADSVAEWIASQHDSKMVKAIRTNQWIVRGETLDDTALDRAVRETIRHSARSLFDLYHYIQDSEAARRLIVLDATTQELARRPEFDGRGLMVVGLHLSNFDFVLQSLCRWGMKPFVLTIPNPQGGRRVEFEMRKRTGMNLVPVSVGALRQALRHLQQGGAVLTGIDRPIPEPKTCPRFFGHPAALPMHHIFLAAKAQVPVMIMVTNFQEDGKYHVLTSDLIEMDSHPDREQEALQNAEKVLNIAERFIRQVPEQWSISLPVWPGIMDQVLD